MNMCIDCWNKIFETSVQKCWEKAQRLPVVNAVTVDDGANLNIVLPQDLVSNSWVIPHIPVSFNIPQQLREFREIF